MIKISALKIREFYHSSIVFGSPAYQKCCKKITVITQKNSIISLGQNTIAWYFAQITNN